MAGSGSSDCVAPPEDAANTATSIAMQCRPLTCLNMPAFENSKTGAERGPTAQFRQMVRFMLGSYAAQGHVACESRTVSPHEWWGHDLMKHTIEFKDWTPDEQIRELVELEVGRLQRLTRTRRPESLFLRVVVDRNTTRTLYRVAI